APSRRPGRDSSCRRRATFSSIRPRTSRTTGCPGTRPSTWRPPSPTIRAGWCIFHAPSVCATPIEASMLKRLAALVTALLVMPVAAQQRAPQNDSIRQSDLRADLFFLAGDAMRGRLTDTGENRAAADYIRSRFERMGLVPPAPNLSYFHTYNLMTANVRDDNTLDVVTSDRAVRRLRRGQEFYPHRFSASGQVTGPVGLVGFGINAARLEE